ncbi:MAG: hypothetical protein ISS82_04150 [Nanoarchaeota archaeon]|nr:hypothetical protein [Nanoarchaeota archaeon]
MEIIYNILHFQYKFDPNERTSDELTRLQPLQEICGNNGSYDVVERVCVPKNAESLELEQESSISLVGACLVINGVNYLEGLTKTDIIYKSGGKEEQLIRDLERFYGRKPKSKMFTTHTKPCL